MDVKIGWFDSAVLNMAIFARNIEAIAEKSSQVASEPRKIDVKFDFSLADGPNLELLAIIASVQGRKPAQPGANTRQSEYRFERWDDFVGRFPAPMDNWFQLYITEKLA